MKPLKILHIGNIANNAFNNAKLLNAAGHDNDVICYDYYHVMGCPEWEDADFKVGPGDDFFPKWWAVRKGRYQRPRWFAQGPLLSCIKYLKARRQEKRFLAGLRWRQLQLYRFLISLRFFREIHSAYLHREKHTRSLEDRLHRYRSRVSERLDDLLSHSAAAMRGTGRLLGPLVSLHERFFSGASLYELYVERRRRWLASYETMRARLHSGIAKWGAAGTSPLGVRLADTKRYFALALVRLVDILVSPLYELVILASLLLYLLARIVSWIVAETGNVLLAFTYLLLMLWHASTFAVSLLALLVLRGPPIALRAARTLFRSSRIVAAWSARQIAGWLSGRDLERVPLKEQLSLERETFDARVQELMEYWHSRFGDREDKIGQDDFEPYRTVIGYWRQLFDEYDVIIGYSTDPILPMLCGKPYFAFEHGTLRSIPFEPTAQGRLTALAYSKSEHSFVTNFDCWENAVYLCGEDAITAINHPYDEDHGLSVGGIEHRRRQLQNQLDADFIFFFPTRQDWVEGTGYADKANDVFLRAFGRLRKEGFRVGLVCCTWGSNVQQSRALLDQLGVSRHVKWIQPLGIVEFSRVTGASDVVVDQFKLGAFGGVLFKSMSMGKPMCTFLDESQVSRQYPVPPPVINCRTEEEIFTELSGLLADPSRLEDMSKGSRSWIKRYHGSRDTVAAQLVQFGGRAESSPIEAFGATA